MTTNVMSVAVAMSEGTCQATLHLPTTAPAPAVILYHDGGGKREVFDEMAARISSFGFVVLVPDAYYRTPHAPFDMATTFFVESERTRLGSLVATITPGVIIDDAAHYIAFVLNRPEVLGQTLGVAGYCMGGRTAITVAGHFPEVVGAMSFHGGNLAVADNPDSPHLHADHMRAEIFVAGATQDASFPVEQQELLRHSLVTAGVAHTIETFEGFHGFAVRDNPTFDPVQAERHFVAIQEFFARTLVQ